MTMKTMSLTCDEFWFLVPHDHDDNGDNDDDNCGGVDELFKMNPGEDIEWPTGNPIFIYIIIIYHIMYPNYS